MPEFSDRSMERLKTCHHDLYRLFAEVVKEFDCSILEGHRDQVRQMIAFQEGKSKLDWPLSRHNRTPSLAVDVAPYPIEFWDEKRFYYFAGFVKGVAQRLGIRIRWGGDWDGDTHVKDQTFNDLVHLKSLFQVERKQSHE